MRDDFIIHDLPLADNAEKIVEFVTACPWVTRGGILSDADPRREFSAFAIEGFAKYLRLTAIPCNMRDRRCLRKSVDKVRASALAYQDNSRSLNKYRAYQGTTGDLVIAAYMTGFMPLINNRISSLDTDDYLSYFDKTPRVLRDTRGLSRSYWWLAHEKVGRKLMPTLCLTPGRVITKTAARSSAEELLGRRIHSIEKVKPKLYLP